VKIFSKSLAAHRRVKQLVERQTWPTSPAIIAAVGRFFPLLPGIRVCQQKL
jgi:hypothetical protein